MEKEIRYAIRSLLKRPGFLITAVITLALGIGANTAIFSVVNAVVLRPLPYVEPDRLVVLYETMPGSDHRSVAPGNFADWREQNKTFEGIAASFNGNFNLTGAGEPERVDGATITSNLMSILGVRAKLGRTFQADDDEHQDRNVVLISEGLWKRRFGANLTIVGQPLTIDESQYAIVGVMGNAFQYPAKAELWVLGRDRNAVSSGLIAQFPQNDWSHERDAHFISVVGRLKQGTSLSQAQSDIANIALRQEQLFPQTNTGLGSNLVPLHKQIVGGIQGVLFVLLGAVGFVLLIACVNVANLMLARAAQRDHEIAIRVALGASRWRLIRELLIESLLLSFSGGTAGLMVSVWVVDLFIRLSPGDIPRLSEARVDLRLLGFTFLISIVTGIGFGLLPAFQATRTNLNNSLKEGESKSSEARRHRRFRSALVMTEIALAQVLLVGAGLLIMSYVRLSQINPGFNADKILSAKIAPSRTRYPDARSRTTFYTTVLDRLQHLPGVTSAGMVMNLPLSGASMNRGFRVEGRQEPKADENVAMDYQVVSADYFSTLEVPIIRGRGFNSGDTETSQRVIVINQAMARRYWPNEDPIGKRMAIGESKKDTSWRTIVGVVGDIRHASLSEPAVPCAFIDYRQDLESWPRMAFVIKGSKDAASLTSAVRRELIAIDPTQPVYGVEPLENLLDTSVAQRRFVMLLIGSLAMVALALAMIGVYGVISFSVSERTHEIGIRMALGAKTRDVLTMVLGQGLRVALAGTAIGLGVAFAFTRFLAGLLFEVSATDPLTFALVGGVLSAVALFACYLPARRATKVDPLVALRYE